MYYVIMLIFCLTIRNNNKGEVCVFICQGYIAEMHIDESNNLTLIEINSQLTI
jgi:hypothetical protein